MMDKTTDSFIQAIKRMADRRGMPSIIHSDNAAEIIKAEKHIKSLYESLNNAATHKELMTKFNLTWYHGPERSPSHNGFIERIVQTIKRPLYKVLNGKLLTEGDMYTVLTSCEAASNSRPLTTTSEHPDDNNILPITPSHLVIGKALSPLPEEIDEYEEKKSTSDIKHLWKQRKQLNQHFWKLWKEEYLTTLRQLTKNYSVRRDIQVGDIVLDLTQRVNKRQWPLAYVEGVLRGRGKEGRVRSVWLRHPIPHDKITKEGKHLTQHKYTKRGIEQISLLEAVNEEEEEGKDEIEDEE